ncbi:hypothetical protein FRB91_008642 [Serendipita sp. 411]|nr:hypothetical protein FRC19_010354 [Serendipita sp. 401]KAG8821987.1 hypothetical protein FRC18_011132 [Serendipita sp. 400]KAG8850982.1 hypothetical protein FRB91_008642 [Serendipita sp. 411]KAG9052619.1 hypothetical protein FS842_009577 [Serendipita sp. 407]
MDDPRYSYDNYTWSRREDGQQATSQHQFLRPTVNSEDSAGQPGPSQASYTAPLESAMSPQTYGDYTGPTYGPMSTFISHSQLRPTVIPSQPLSALYASSPRASPAHPPQTLVPEAVLSGSHSIGGGVLLGAGSSGPYYPDPGTRQYAPPTRTTASDYKLPFSGPVRTSTWRVRTRPYQEPVQPPLSAESRRRTSRDQTDGMGPPLIDSFNTPQVNPPPSVTGPEENLALSEQSLPNCCDYPDQKEFLQAPVDFSGHLLSHPQHYRPLNDANVPSGINLSTSPQSDHLDQGGEFSNWQELSRQNHSPGLESYQLAEPYDWMPNGSDSSRPHSEDGTNGGWSTNSASPMNSGHLSMMATSAQLDSVNGMGINASGTTDFIHSNLSLPISSAAPDPSEDYPEYNNFFPLAIEEHRRLRIAMHNVMAAPWKVRNELEPTPRDVLQFSERIVGPDGSVKYKCLLWHNNEQCGKSWGRSERMAAHLRGAIELRPFPCEGDDEACNCGLRFFAEDTLQQHRKNARTITCDYCTNPVTPRNIKRHLRHNCTRSPYRAS